MDVQFPLPEGSDFNKKEIDKPIVWIRGKSEQLDEASAQNLKALNKKVSSVQKGVQTETSVRTVLSSRKLTPAPHIVFRPKSTPPKSPSEESTSTNGTLECDDIDSVLTDNGLNTPSISELSIKSSHIALRSISSNRSSFSLDAESATNTDRESSQNSLASPVDEAKDNSAKGTQSSKKRSLDFEPERPTESKKLKIKRSTIKKNSPLSFDRSLIIERLSLKNYSTKAQNRIIECYLAKSEGLDLSGCDLTEIPKCLLTELSHVRNLNLSDNRLTELTVNLPKLVYLNVRNNEIVTFNSKLESLESLNLFNNKLNDFNITQDQLPKLINLNIGMNKLLDFTAVLPMLESLHIKSGQLSNFTATDTELPSLNFLDLRDNDELSPIGRNQFLQNFQVYQGRSYDRDLLIRELGLEQYTPDIQKRIIRCLKDQESVLDLSNCNLREVPSCIATRLQHVTNLNLSGNRIESFQAVLPNLKVLNIQGNRLKEIDLSKRNLPNLQSVNISNNRGLTSPSLTGLITSIEKLDLDEIQEVQEMIEKLGLQNYSQEVQQRFISCVKDQSSVLDLSNCELTQIPSCVSKLSYVKELNLSGNRISNPLQGIFPNIIKVNLSQNKLSILPNLKKNFPNLKTLNASINNITQIPDSHPTLEELDISTNNLKDFHGFEGQFPSLKTLNLGGNQLKTFKAWLPNLENLVLKGNFLENISLTKDLLPSLKFIDLSKNNSLYLLTSQGEVLMSELSLEQICESQQLVLDLDIAHLSLEAQERIVRCFFNKESTLDLSGCGLKSIPSCIATQMTHVTELDVSNNQIRTFPRSPASQILRLNLSNNTLPGLPDMDRTFPNLVDLNIADNNITEIRGNFLNLESLVAYGNEISSLDLTQGKFPKLQKEDVTDNLTLRELSITQMRESQEIIKKLKISNYSAEVQQRIISCYQKKIATLDLSNCDLTDVPSCIKDLTHVTQLNLIGNRIESLPNNAFPNIIVLDLSNNRLTAIGNIEKVFPKLKEMNVSNNKIEVFEGSFPTLQTLNVQGNRLPHLELHQEQFPRLRSIDVSDNKIRWIKGSLQLLVELNAHKNFIQDINFAKKQFPMLKYIDLSFNNINSFYGTFPNLVELRIQDNSLTSVSFSRQLFPKLQILNISENPIISMRIDVSNLRDLYMAHTRLSAFPVEPGVLKNLRSLDVRGNLFLTIDQPDFPLLETLQSDSIQVTEKRLIKYLDLLDFSPEVQIRVIQCFHSGSSVLDLSNCGLSTVPSCIKDDLNLTELDLSGNNLTEFTFDMLNLKELNLSRNNLTSFSGSKDQFPELENLNLSHNPGISIDLGDLDIIPEILEE